MKQTAVEWLVDELQRAEWIPKNSSIMNYVISTAKEMEKERMIDFVKKFSDFNGLTFNEKMISKEFLENYYNETFKSE